MKSNPVAIQNIAVLGTGSAGMQHIRAIAGFPGLNPIAVPKREARAAILRERRFQTALSLAQAVDEGARFCIIASDTRDHLEDAKAALSAGMDILVEKPLAPNLKDATDIHSAAKRLGRSAFVGCVMRFSTSLEEFRRRLRNIGKLHSIRIECGSYLPEWRPERDYRKSYSARREDGGVLLDLIHEIDYAGWIFGWPERLQADLANLSRLGIDAPEIADLRWRTRDGAFLTIQLDYLSRAPRRGICARGEEGSLEWNALSDTVTRFGPDGSTDECRTKQTPADRFGRQVQAFMNTGKETTKSPLATCSEGVSALAVCHAARKASASKSEEIVPAWKEQGADE